MSLHLRNINTASRGSLAASTYESPGKVALANLPVFRIVLVLVLILEQAAATFWVPRGFALTLITDGVALLLMLSAVLIFLENAGMKSGGQRLLWVLLAISWGMRFVAQFGWMYFELVLRQEVPAQFVGDVLLFASNIPVLAALLLETQRKPFDWKNFRRAADFMLILSACLYLYLYFVVCWKYASPNEAWYDLSYDRLTLIMDVVQLVVLASLWRRARGRWRWFYAGFFAAYFSFVLNGNVLNTAITQHNYFPGSAYDLGFAIALASFTFVGLLGATMPESCTAPPMRGRSPHLTKIGTVLLLSLPIVTAWSELQQNVPAEVVKYRLLLMSVSVFVMMILVFARQWSLTKDLKKSAAALRAASITDPLTGAHNRRYFDATIQSDVSRVLRSYQRPTHRRIGDLIVYVIDLDYFKDVNDSYGHDVGDKLLLEVTCRINSVVRKTDMLLRWGGDEFLVVSRYSDRSDAANYASRIMTAIAGSDGGLSICGHKISQTCSIGWAAFPWHPESPSDVPLETVLALADRGVYEAKAAGRHRAAGVIPSEAPDLIMMAPVADQVCAFSVQLESVLGPARPSHQPAQPTAASREGSDGPSMASLVK